MCSSFPGLLIGRTAVHSGKDPAFVAYDQFLSTGILQPLSRGEVRCGSKAVRLKSSKCLQVCASKQTQGVYEYTPSPNFSASSSTGSARLQTRRSTLVVPAYIPPASSLASGWQF